MSTTGRARTRAEVAEVLSVPPGFTAALLRHFRWGGGRRGSKEEWFFDDWRIRDAVGLPAYGGPPIATARRRQ